MKFECMRRLKPFLWRKKKAKDKLRRADCEERSEVPATGSADREECSAVAATSSADREHRCAVAATGSADHEDRSASAPTGSVDLKHRCATAATRSADREGREPAAVNGSSDTAQKSRSAPIPVDDTLDRTSVKTFINTYREQRLGAPPSPPIVRRRSSAGEEDTAIELPPEGAENEMEEGTALDYDSDEFFDAVEDPAMRSASILLDDYQKSTRAPDEEHRWGDSDHDWKVRGKKYLKDKVKVSSAPPTATLLAVDLAHSGGPDILQMTAQPQSAYECTRRSGNTEFLIVVNWRCPPMHVVNVFGMKDPQSDCLFQRFLKMDKEERNQRLKVVPFCPEGPWLARTAIGSTPVIIGNKIETTYFDGPDYLEISINVFSSSAAKRMMNVVCGVAKKMVIDVALLVEGRREDELPERVLGAFRVIRSDITKMRQLDTN